MLDDDLDIDIPECDLYISYVRHPDVIIQFAELEKPLILGVLPGMGLFSQASSINSQVVHARTMCSLENNTGIPIIDEFTKIFGRPLYEVDLDPSGTIKEIKVKRSSLCGSTDAGATFLENKGFEPENLQNFALHVCHECRAPRFGRTCDKEVAGLIHLMSLFESIESNDSFEHNDKLQTFMTNTKEEFARRASS